MAFRISTKNGYKAFFSILLPCEWKWFLNLMRFHLKESSVWSLHIPEHGPTYFHLGPQALSLSITSEWRSRGWIGEVFLLAVCVSVSVWAFAHARMPRKILNSFFKTLKTFPWRWSESYLRGNMLNRKYRALTVLRIRY